MPAKLRLLLTIGFSAVLLAMFAPPSSAITLAVGGGQLDVGFACESGAGSCSGSADFDLSDSASASGTITLGGMGITTADVMLSLPMAHMVGSSGGVTDIEFRNVTVEGSIPVLVSGDLGSVFSVIPIGAGSGELNGSYDQFDGGGPSPVGGLVAELANLSCALSGGLGQCGVQLGRDDFDLSIGGSQHDFVWIADLSIVPEPSTGMLVGLGLIVLASARRKLA